MSGPGSRIAGRMRPTLNRQDGDSGSSGLKKRPSGAAGSRDFVERANLVRELGGRAVDDRAGHDLADRQRRDRDGRQPHARPATRPAATSSRHRRSVRGRPRRARRSTSGSARRTCRRSRPRAPPADRCAPAQRAIANSGCCVASQRDDVVVVLEEHLAVSPTRAREPNGSSPRSRARRASSTARRRWRRSTWLECHATLPVTSANVTNAPPSASSICCTGELGCPLSSMTARSHSSQFAHPSACSRAVTDAKARREVPLAPQPLGGVPGSGLGAHHLVDVVGDLAELAHLCSQGGRRDAELPARLEERRQVGRVVVARPEVLPRVDADDHVEGGPPERQRPGIHPHRQDLAVDALLREDLARLRGVDPEIHRHDLHSVLLGEEDRGRAQTGPEVEHPHPGPEVQVVREVLEQPQRVRAHVEVDEPLRVVLVRPGEIVLGQVVERRHRFTST